MEKRSVIIYHWLGVRLRYLQDVRSGAPIHGDLHVRGNLGEVLKILDTLDLRVTKKAAAKLEKFKGELDESADDANLSMEQGRKLHELILTLRPTLTAELSIQTAYIVTSKALDVNKLVDDVSSLFAPNVFNVLPEIARYDFTEAGKCIAFERPTAAAFHLLRGTEAVLRNFYEQLVKRERIKTRMWGPIIEHLRKRPATAKYASLYANLDNIRQHYRNPTQHPELIYDVHEVQDLWSLCVAVVNHMVRVLAAEQK